MKTAIKEADLNARAAKDRIASGTVSLATVLACACPALILATVCLLPFLNKAFLIDDPHFLTMARQIVKHPMHPMDFDICWNTIDDCAKAYQLTPGNALMGYVLVPTVLTGAHEWTAHLTQLALVWIAILAMTSLIFRFGFDRWHAILGALLLVAIPPFLPMASTAMPDILATAVALVAMERLAAWKAERKWWSQGVTAAIALGLAGYARSHLALLLPLAAFFLLDSLSPKEIVRQVRREFWLWTPVIAGSGLLSAIILVVREHNLAISAPPVVVGQHTAANVVAYFLYISFPIPLAACWLANRFRAGWVWVIMILALSAFAANLSRVFHSPLPFFVVIGYAALAALLFDGFKKRDPLCLFLVFWILIPLPIVYYTHLPMKYLLPCMPAAILLCFRLMEGFSAQVFRIAALVFIVASTGYSVLILRSDAEFADFGRDSLSALIRPHVEAGERVWFGGQYWSYWYAPLDGATLTFPGGPQPQAGDLLVVDALAAEGHSPLKRFPHRTLVETITHKYRFGRTMGAGIGLYSNGMGFWLWGFGESSNDRFELWRID